jgi:uncharacterized protein (TIGR03437 family)
MPLCRWLLLVVALVSASAQSRDDRWREDVDYLARELTRRHPNPFTIAPRAEFDRIVAAVRADIPALSDRALQVRIAEIAACVRDGHTNLPLWNLPAASIAVRWFDDGLWVIGAPRDHPEWLGTRVVSVGGMPIEDAHRSLKRVISFDNEHGTLVWSEIYFARPDIWHALGVTPSPAELPLGLERPAGGRMEAVALFGQPVTHNAVTAAGGFVPLWQMNSGSNYWYATVLSARTLYVAYNRCAESASYPVARFADEVFATFDSNPIDRLVVDVRNNPGGSSTTFDPFFERLSRRRNRFTSGTGLFSIIGRDTASSGMDAALKLRHNHGAITLGQPTSGKPDSFGNFETFKLPNSGLEVRVSTKWFDQPGSGDAVLPDQRVGFAARDYFTRHDPFLAAVMSHSPTPWTSGLPAVRNAASFRAEPGVAPGSYVTLFGRFSSPGPVLFGEAAAQTVYADTTQINAVVPDDLSLGETAVTVGGEPLGRVHIVAANPGVFSVNPADLRQPGAVLNADNTLNAIDNRARGSQVIQAFGTGFAADQPAAFIGFVLCRVLHSGRVEGFPGLWQVNVEVPTVSAVRGMAPLYFVSGGIRSNAVSMYIE